MHNGSGTDEQDRLVLGGGGGLGSEIARVLSEEGAKVAVADIDAKAAQTIAESIEATGNTAMALAWDLGALSQIEPNVDRIEADLGDVDVGGPPPGSVAGQNLDLWRKHLESMVLSIFAATDRVLPGMRRQGWGRIVTSTSSGVVAPIPNLGLSNALRCTLVGWSKTLAEEIGGDGVTANIIVP